jgi:ubiquinone/menaquinone biosynthesis C-methylase UbiE
MINKSSAMPNPVATAATRRRYERLSPFYDSMEGMSESRYLPWRTRLWSLVQGHNVLEVGIGTGRNMQFYPAGISITGIDITPGMLQRAQKLTGELRLSSRVELQLGDVQQLDFPDNNFESAVATFVFCSVPDPVLGLRELKRVVKPGGCVFLLEHMRSPNPFLGVVMDILNPLIVLLMGANINRRTLENIRNAGLEIMQVEDLTASGIFKLIVARVTPK